MGQSHIYQFPFEDLPDSPGLYAFYFNLGIFQRYSELAREQGFGKVDISAPFQKAVRSTKLTRQSGAKINLYGKSKCNYVSLSSEHHINLGLEEVKADQVTFEQFSSVISSCLILSAPLYIGITKRNFEQRLSEHRDKYQKLENEEKTFGEADIYTPEGEFYEQIYKRELSFRDLIFVCVPIEEVKEARILKLVERFLQSTCNPPLSISH